MSSKRSKVTIVGIIAAVNKKNLFFFHPRDKKLKILQQGFLMNKSFSSSHLDHYGPLEKIKQKNNKYIMFNVIATLSE